MGVRRSEERLAEAAKLYYVDDLNQEEVANALGTTRSNVSRMLQAARDRGIITFHVRHPLTRQGTLERQLVETFGISEAVVLGADTGTQTINQAGELAARWLAGHVSDGMTIALSWGTTLKAMAEQLDVDRAYDVDVVPLSGDLPVAPEISGCELVREVALRLGGRYSLLAAPAVLGNAATVRELVAQPGIGERLDAARKADIAVVGIGAYGDGAETGIGELLPLTDGERRELADADPVGDIASRFFDRDGKEVGPLTERVLGLDLDALRQIPVVAGVAAGPKKARGLWGALRGGLLDVVVCDHSAAAAALQLQRDTE